MEDAAKSDNFCANDLLYFADFKRKTSALTGVIAVCERFYSADSILEAKKTFFDLDCVQTKQNRDGLRFVNRRGENATKTNLEDLILAMNKCDNDDVLMPTFVSTDFANVPHEDSGNVSLGQLLNMLVDMKRQISKLEKRLPLNSAPSHSTDPVMTHEITAAMSPMMMTSATMVASTASTITHDASAASTTTAAASAASTTTAAASMATTTTTTASTASTTMALAASVSNSTSAPTAVQTASSSEQTIPKTAVSDAAPNESALAPASGSEMNWSVAARRPRRQQPSIRSAEERVKSNFTRKRETVIGKKPSSGEMSWGGANLTVPCYIGQVDFSVSADMIKADLINRGIDVIDISENITRHKLYKSFKLVVKKTDFGVLYSPDAWPEGIVFRRFHPPKERTDAGHENALAIPL